MALAAEANSFSCTYLSVSLGAYEEAGGRSAEGKVKW
jgi:hypothetical protein